MKTKEEIINFFKSDENRAILNEIWVKHIYLVWSFVRWENKEDSDVDLVYQEIKDFRVWWIKFLRNKILLEEKLNKQIDLVEEKSINKHYKNSVNIDKEIIF